MLRLTQLHRAALLPCPILAVTAALLLGSAQPRAQTGEEASIALPEIGVSGTPGATARPGYLAPATATATRTDTALRDVPQSVVSTTQQAIRDLSMQSIADVLRYTPGAGVAQGEGNRDTPVLRGQATTASLFVDGLRDDVQIYRDLYNLDRVEVLLGPQRDDLRPRRRRRRGEPRDAPRRTGRPVREVRLEAGSFTDFRGSFDVGPGDHRASSRHG
jgi:catecholate siderophore receptor